MKKRLIYLASPYTLYANSPERLEYAVEQAARYAAKLMSQGYAAFSPVVHSHHIADHLDPAMRLDHDFWMEQDLAILEHCEGVFVLCLPGWRDSKGIEREIAEANRLRKQVRFVLPDPVWGYKVRVEVPDAAA